MGSESVEVFVRDTPQDFTKQYWRWWYVKTLSEAFAELGAGSVRVAVAMFAEIVTIMAVRGMSVEDMKRYFSNDTGDIADA